MAEQKRTALITGAGRGLGAAAAQVLAETGASVVLCDIDPQVEAVAAELRARADYTQRAKQAEAFGDKGLQVQLENIVSDETGHFEEVERMLQEWRS